MTTLIIYLTKIKLFYDITHDHILVKDNINVIVTYNCYILIVCT